MDAQDPDDDGDGIPTSEECPDTTACTDTDQDGIPDYQDPDDDGDGIPTSEECPNPTDCTDTDQDGIPDYQEPDNQDSDNDGIMDAQDPDDDGDGIPTSEECPDPTACTDTDQDGIPDYQDPDDDGDGIPTSEECSTGIPCADSDGDRVPDYLDPDRIADLEVYMDDAPENVLVGEQIEYNIRINNKGPDSSTGAVLSSTMSLHAEVFTGTFNLAQDSCTSRGEWTVCTLGNLNPGDNGLFSLDVGAPIQPTTLRIQNVLYGPENDDDMSNNTAETTIIIEPTSPTSTSIPTPTPTPTPASPEEDQKTVYLPLIGH
jgi:uncharacterized repeat protein (TIGR01451 family)